MFVVENPAAGQVREYELPVNENDRSQGSFRMKFRTIPMGKYRSLTRKITDKERHIERLGLILQKLREESAGTTEEAVSIEERREKFSRERSYAEEDLVVAVKQLLAWGLAGHSEIVDTKHTPIPVELTREKWAGVEYEVLGAETLALYQRLHLLEFLEQAVLVYHEGKLPDTIDGFFPEKKETPPDPT